MMDYCAAGTDTCIPPSQELPANNKGHVMAKRATLHTDSIVRTPQRYIRLSTMNALPDKV